MATNQPNENTRKARGQRLKQLRELAGLTRSQVQARYGVSPNTLASWEMGRGAGVSLQGARSMVAIYQREGIRCNHVWVMEGAGSAPQRASSLDELHNDVQAAVLELQTSTVDIDYFKSRYPEIMVYEVKDDSMAPCFKAGDVVMGLQQVALEFTALHGKDCIVETNKNQILLRRFHIGKIPHTYNLIATNPDCDADLGYLLGVEVKSCAPVTWIRRGKNW